jgi:hypothetical protein
MTIEVSKVNIYAVLNGAGAEASKVNAYAVLNLVPGSTKLQITNDQMTVWGRGSIPNLNVTQEQMEVWGHTTGAILYLIITQAQMEVWQLTNPPSLPPTSVTERVQVMA